MELCDPPQMQLKWSITFLYVIWKFGTAYIAIDQLIFMLLKKLDKTSQGHMSLMPQDTKYIQFAYLIL